MNEYALSATIQISKNQESVWALNMKSLNMLSYVPELQFAYTYFWEDNIVVFHRLPHSHGFFVTSVFDSKLHCQDRVPYFVQT